MSLDPDTFLTGLYVLVDDYCKALAAVGRRPGPARSLTRSEVVTLALFGQWARFASERDFYRYAARRLRGAFPRLPDRGQLNRLIRAEYAAIVAVGHHLAGRLGAGDAAYEVLDATAAPVRNVKRRGWGWLPEYAARGWSNRLGWYEGFHLLVAATPEGAITGYGVGPADAKDQPLAETFFAARATRDPRLPTVGRASGEPYLADSGFIGAALHAHWRADYGARVLCPPNRSARRNWPRALRRWLAGRRQVIEAVNAALLLTFRLDRERPHTLGGFHARLAAKVALHNFCCWLNRQLGRPPLAFADLIAW
jgi:Transposase DDE domain